MGEPVLMRWECRCAASFDADLFQVVEYLHRLLFAGPLPGRRGPAAATWDLTGRVLDVSFVDREGG